MRASIVATDSDGWWVTMTPTLARIARECLAEVATPGGSLGDLYRAGKRFAYVEVGNPLADDYGSHRFPIESLRISPRTIDYWRRQGYLA